MMDQAEGLRAWTRAGAARARSVAVTSGKGGVGKTNLAANLAIAAARRGLATILVDADFGLANADLILDLEPRWNLSHVLAGEVEALDALVEGPGGIRLLAGASGIRRLADLEPEGREEAIRAFERLEEAADLIVLDTGAGISRSVVAVAAAADEIVVATCPEPPAIADAYAVVKAVAAEGEHGRIWTVVNMAASRSEAALVAGRIVEVARDFLGVEVRWAGYVPDDPSVALAVKRRRPFLLDAPDAPASRAMQAILAAVAPGAREASGRGWLERLRLRRPPSASGRA